MIEKIAKEVAEFSGLTVDELRYKGRFQKYVEPRQVAMKVTYDLCDLSETEIGKFYNNKDHATINHARKTVKNLLETNKVYRKKWDKFIKKLKNMDYKTELRKDREKICDKYIKLFCKKHDLYFDHWIGDEVGGVADFGVYSFSFTSIVKDIDEDIEAGLILQWYDNSVENQDTSINLKSYALRQKKEAPN